MGRKDSRIVVLRSPLPIDPGSKFVSKRRIEAKSIDKSLVNPIGGFRRNLLVASDRSTTADQKNRMNCQANRVSKGEMSDRQDRIGGGKEGTGQESSRFCLV
jgi:hypothetical protein